MNQDAPDGYVFVCFTCGKTSADKYGYKTAAKGWDVSCILNSGLVPRNKIVWSEDNGTVVKELLN